jgi:hypothetical protein
MKNLFYLFLFFPVCLIAQEKRPFFVGGDFYISSDVGRMQNLNFAKQNSLASIKNRAGITGGAWSVMDFGMNVYNNHHVFFGVDVNFNSASLDSKMLSYLNTKYPNQTNVVSSSQYALGTTYTYVGYGFHKAFKNFTILPFITGGSQFIRLSHYKFLLTNSIDNQANTYFLDYRNPVLRAKESVRPFKVALNMRTYYKPSSGPIAFYFEPGLNIWNQDLDLIQLEREELSGKTESLLYDYGTIKVSGAIKVGATLRVLKKRK